MNKIIEIYKPNIRFWTSLEKGDLIFTNRFITLCSQHAFIDYLKNLNLPRETPIYESYKNTYFIFIEFDQIENYALLLANGKLRYFNNCLSKWNDLLIKVN